MTFTPAMPQLPETTAYSSPVPREFVHKSTHAEVLLTGWRQCGEREFEVGAQWPRDHGFWRTDGGVQDPMLLVETTRQVLPLLSHTAYGVPRDHQLIWDHHQCAFAAPLLRVTDRPADVVLRISASHAPAGNGRLRRLTLKMTAGIPDGRTLGTATTVFSAHRPEVYARLRGPGTPPPPEAMAAALPAPAPVGPSLVGRESDREVVLGPAEGTGRRQLRVLTSSPWLFDHPVDHLPGMLLMEAARQCGLLGTSGRRPHLVRLEAEFTRYVDLDAPSFIEILSGPEAGAPSGVEGAPDSAPDVEERLRVGVTQYGRTAFTAEIGFSGVRHLEP
jgi:2-oxo-3-(phosphooxy)propyl 3-oxoalkanoate synthase